MPLSVGLHELTQHVRGLPILRTTSVRERGTKLPFDTNADSGIFHPSSVACGYTFVYPHGQGAHLPASERPGALPNNPISTLRLCKTNPMSRAQQASREMTFVNGAGHERCRISDRVPVVIPDANHSTNGGGPPCNLQGAQITVALPTPAGYYCIQ